MINFILTWVLAAISLAITAYIVPAGRSYRCGGDGVGECDRQTHSDNSHLAVNYIDLGSVSVGD